MLGAAQSIKYAAILGTVIFVLAGLWYITGLRADLVTSTENVKKLESAVVEQQDTIVRMQQDQATIREINSTLAARARKQDKDIVSLKERFNTGSNGDSRNFASIAAANPGLIERAINKGSRNAARCIEIATGSSLTEAEKSATNTDEINKECPALANPLYKPDTSN